MSTVVCYKTKTPVYYNKGTQWEKTHDVFLAYYTFKSVEEAQKEVDELNATKPAKLWNDAPIDWDDVAYFFVQQQGEMY